MRKSLLLALLVLVGVSSKAQNYLTESFDGTTFPPTNWTTSNGGTGATAASWTRVTAGTFPTQSPNSGAGEAKFNSFNASTGNYADLITPSINFSSTTGTNQVSFWLYRDNGYPNNLDRVDVAVNTTASYTGATVLGTINLSTTQTPTVSSVGWYQYTFNIPASFNGTTNYIIFRGISAFGDNIYIDDVSVDHLVPCSGTISGGTATASPNPVCQGVAFSLSVTGYTIAGNMQYQWQSSPAGANTWTNITGATTATYAVPAGITAATDYRFQATCVSTTNVGTSNTVAVTLNPPTNCYCTSAATSTADDDIGQVVVGCNFANPSSTPSALTSNSASSALYTNFTATAPVIKIIAGLPTKFEATQINSGGYYNCWLKAFIDLNGDGDFTDPNEEAFTSAGLGAAGTPSFSGTITIPCATTPKITRMRVVLRESGTQASTTPCGTYTWGETEDYTVQILPPTPPAPKVTTTAPVCPGATFTVTVADTSNFCPLPANAAQFTLTGPGGSLGPQANGVFTFNNATAAMAGNYTATSTIGCGTSVASLPATVPIFPVANLTTGAITMVSICTAADGSIVLNGLQPSTAYTLTFDRNGVAQPSRSITSDASGSYTFGGLIAANYTNIKVTNTGANGSCVSNSVSGVVPAPNPPATPIVIYQKPLCPGSTLQLSVTNPVPGATYTWSSNPAGFNPPNGLTATRPNMTPAQNGDYCATASLNGCVSVPGCVTVTVNNKDPRPLVTSPITYCQFEMSMPLTAVPVDSNGVLTYYGPIRGTINIPPGPDSTNIARSIIYPRTDTAMTFVYRVTQFKTCVSDSASIIVIIKPKPPMPVISSPIVELCQFSPAGPLSASGQSIRWYNTPTGGAGSTTAPVPNTLISGTFFYYVSQTVSGCESDRRVVTVNVKPKPAPPQVSSPLNLCQGDPMGPVTAIGQNLKWYPSPTGGVGVPIPPTPNTGYEDSFKYWVTQTVNGCESDRALLSVYVNYKPNGVIVGSNQSVCQDDTLSFFYYGNARPDAQYVWFAPFPQSHIYAGNNTQGPLIVKFDSAGTQIIRLQINNKGCISTLVAAPITVRPLPKMDYSLKRDVCQDELVDISLTYTQPGVNNYSFDFGSNDTTMQYSAVPGGPFGIRYHSVGEFIVAATATLNGCTSKPLEKRISVHEIPDARITPPVGRDLNNVCNSDTLTFSVQNPRDGATYTWTPRTYFQAKEDSLNYTVRAVVSQSGVVKVRVETAYGCVGTDSIVVMTKPCCGVYFANAFAPEGNVEVNRTFKPITIGFHKVNVFRIVNRWGQVVYETKNERAGWNGTFNGVKQDMGTYYYYISYVCEGKTMEEHGEVTLMR
jgi:gliding motility-associated-like protein